MDLLAKERVLFVLIFSGVMAPVFADGNIYAQSAVDYFGMKGKVPSTVPPLVWSEDGHAAPQVVVALLNDPGPVTAAAYLAWNEARLRQIRAAAQAVDEALQKAASTVGRKP